MATQNVDRSATRIATHNGPFHADDVLAVALIRSFYDAEASVVRSRDKAVLEAADIVVDVGGSFDPAALRFDHHQVSYSGPLSSAGMLLDWLDDTGRLAPGLRAFLHDRLVGYVDDVDNGRVEPRGHVPDFTTMVSVYNRGCHTLDEFDARFAEAASMAREVVRGLQLEHTEITEAEAVVVQAMDAAKAAGSVFMELPRYVRWKGPYFARGGAEHITEYVVLPGMDGSWRVLGIPPEEGSFAQKRPLPEAWAGLVDEELSAVTGVPGSRFCHKNRFIAVFDTEQALWDAMATVGILRR